MFISPPKNCYKKKNLKFWQNMDKDSQKIPNQFHSATVLSRITRSRPFGPSSPQCYQNQQHQHQNSHHRNHIYSLYQSTMHIIITNSMPIDALLISSAQPQPSQFDTLLHYSTTPQNPIEGKRHQSPEISTSKCINLNTWKFSNIITERQQATITILIHK